MIYLLPGMGATSEMYDGPWRDMLNSMAVDWPEYHGEKTMLRASKLRIERQLATA